MSDNTAVPRIISDVEDVQITRLTSSTEVVVCGAVNCLFNMMNCAANPDMRAAECNFKEISINPGGGCAFYERVSE